jgi:hypothetical protein
LDIRLEYSFGYIPLNIPLNIHTNKMMKTWYTNFGFRMDAKTIPTQSKVHHCEHCKESFPCQSTNSTHARFCSCVQEIVSFDGKTYLAFYCDEDCHDTDLVTDSDVE